MKRFQKKVEEFAKKYKLKHKPEITALDLVSEIGQVAKEILENSKCSKKTNPLNFNFSQFQFISPIRIK